MYWLILIFILIPAGEIGVFIWTGSKIGALPVVVLIILTGVAGAALVRIQGIETWRRAQLSMANNEAPKEQILDGICIIASGILLLTPGFITDILGFLLVIPWTRKPFKIFVAHLIMKKLRNGHVIYRKW